MVKPAKHQHVNIVNMLACIYLSQSITVAKYSFTELLAWLVVLIYHYTTRLFHIFYLIIITDACIQFELLLLVDKLQHDSAWKFNFPHSDGIMIR